MAFSLGSAAIVTAMAWGVLAGGFASQQLQAADAGASGGAKVADDQDVPTPAPLTVGAMAIASNSDLAIEGMAVDVAADKVTYSYRLRNKGSAKLLLAASVTLPDLEVNTEANTIYDLPSQTPENPVNLVVKANDQPVATLPSIQAIALGIDRLADLKSAGFPLIPFGPSMDKAVAATRPEVLAKLGNLGLFSPHDPTQPETPVNADWSLHVVQAWMQPIDPAAAMNLTVSFAPIKAVYHVDAANLVGLNVLKDQVCLTPAVMSAARALIKNKDAQADVDDIVLANDGPARWLDNPAATIAVRKPQPNSIVIFCGMDAASAGKPVVTGKMPGSSDASGLRILIFSAKP